MPFTINEFTSELNKHGVAKASDFSVIITAPPAVTNGAEAWLPLRIEAVNIPSRTLMTIEQRYHGPTRFMPYSFIHTPVSITVLLSEDMRERDFFMRWQDLAVTKDGMGTPRTSSVPDPSGGRYDSNYYDDAVKPGKIEIQQYPGSAESGDAGVLGAALGVARSVGLDPTIVTRPLGFDIGLTPAATPPKAKTKIFLNECFPRTVQDISMNWANGDELAKLQVELVYFDITEVYEGAEEEGNSFNDSLTGLPGVVRKGVNTLNRFRPLISGIRNGSLRRTITGGAGSSFRNVGSNIRIF